MPKKRLLSLYSGVGGMDLGAHAANFETVAFCEADPKCREYLTHHFPGRKVYETDTDVSAARLYADGIWPIDIVAGGPPCQGASLAGKGLGPSDPRWRWPEFLRIVGEVRPSWVVAENPPGLLSVCKGEAFAAIMHEMEQMGYLFGWPVFGVDALGAPQKRDRVFLTGRRVANAVNVYGRHVAR